MRSALWLPLFDELSDPLTVARVAAEAEAAGWHGVFVWDKLRWPAPVRQAADPWITLAAIATASERLRLGPMVTPVPRRRPAKVARETATLDGLSRGRLTLGVGIGSDRFGGEFSKTGEQLDDQVRGKMLDEALHILTAAWSGEPVHHHGHHYTIDGIQFLPRPVQRPGVPIWIAGYPGDAKPMRRAVSVRRLLSGRPRPLRSACRNRRHARRAASRPDHALRHRRRPPRRRRPRALRQGRRHLVAPRVRTRTGVTGPGARRAS